MSEIFEKKEELSKQILIFWRIVVFGAPSLFLILIYTKFILKIPLNNGAFLVGLYFLFCIYFIPRINSAKVLGATIISGMAACWVLLYLFAPLLINFLGSIALPTYVVYVFFLGNTFNLSLGKWFVYIFLVISLLLSCSLLFFEYFGQYPSYGNYIINNYFLKNDFHLGSSLVIFIVGLSFFTFHTNSFLATLEDKLNNLLQARLRVAEMKSSLEERVRERTEDLEEAKIVLEIKVQARTRELAALAANLEKDVFERTKELQKRVEELEKFSRLSSGRGKRLTELDKEINKLNN